jgi:hypothetical protein
MRTVETAHHRQCEPLPLRQTATTTPILSRVVNGVPYDPAGRAQLLKHAPDRFSGVNDSRRVFNGAVLFAAALLTTTLANAAAIEGVVLNGATGSPQPGATVTLVRLASANGPEALESVKSDASGRFSMTKEVPGPRMLQAAFDGVTYSQVLTPATPSHGVTINVFPSSTKPGAAHVDQHMLLLEPTPSNQLNISESFVYLESTEILG